MQLEEDIPEHNLHQGTSAIIIDYCSRYGGQEDGYLLEVLDANNLAFDVIAATASKIEVATANVSQR
ncbi:DUF4926 domain-containing protein [Lusitaniella coriacea]|uniref:DUF4926 domain-containing protein n=1 Tax=Lusitaniella coriacea TaxID=1983105 RepID=UPI003CFAB15F